MRPRISTVARQCARPVPLKQFGNAVRHSSAQSSPHAYNNSAEPRIFQVPFYNASWRARGSMELSVIKAIVAGSAAAAICLWVLLSVLFLQYWRKLPALVRAWRRQAWAGATSLSPMRLWRRVRSVLNAAGKQDSSSTAHRMACSEHGVRKLKRRRSVEALRHTAARCVRVPRAMAASTLEVLQGKSTLTFKQVKGGRGAGAQHMEHQRA